MTGDRHGTGSASGYRTPPAVAGSPEEMLARARRSQADAGFSMVLGGEILRCWNGEAEYLVPVTDRLKQNSGFVHGAVIGACADNVCAWAAASLVGEALTANYTLHLLAPALGERLRASATVIRSGRSQSVVRADVHIEDGRESKLVATALATIAHIQSRQEERVS